METEKTMEITTEGANDLIYEETWDAGCRKQGNGLNLTRMDIHNHKPEDARPPHAIPCSGFAG